MLQLFQQYLLDQKNCRVIMEGCSTGTLLWSHTVFFFINANHYHNVH